MIGNVNGRLEHVGSTKIFVERSKMNSKEQSNEPRQDQKGDVTISPEPVECGMSAHSADISRDIESLLTQMNRVNRQNALWAKDVLSDTPTPTALVKKRPGRGGETWHYVEIFPMLRELKKRYPIHFFSVFKAEIAFTDAIAVVELEIWEYARPARKYIGVGSIEVPIHKTTGKPVSFGDAISAAVTMAKKKAMAYAGIYTDVYGDDANKYTIADVSMKDELYNFAVNRVPDATLKDIKAALAKDMNIDEFNRVKGDIEGLVEKGEIERRHEET